MANQRQSIHGQWSSKIMFIFAATGSAVGLGNIWKFPWMVSESGGGAFVLIYIASVILIALPIMVAEVFIGRHGKQNPVASLQYLSKESSSFDVTEIDDALNRVKTKKQKYSNSDDFSNWQLVGWGGIIAGIFILSFYSVIAGWTMSYILKAGSGAFNLIDLEGSKMIFANLVADPIKLMGWHTAFMILTCYIVAQGVKGGLEKAVKFLIPGLFIILIGLAVYSTALSGFSDGMKYMFVPELSKINSSVVLSAIGMAFFSLSIGMGSLMIYGSYLSNESSIGEVTAIVAFADTSVAILAGLIIFPIVFTYNLDPSTAGPGLIFETLPIAFGSMPGGSIIATLFFILLFFAAITSSISLIEPAISFLIERYSMSRVEASVKMGFITWFLGIGTLLSFNLISDYKLLGMNFFGILDGLTSKIMLPLGGLLMAIFTGYIVKKKIVMDELRMGPRKFNFWLILIRYVAPIAVTLIFVRGLF
ncbi:MAG: sodium-dependent transporter [Gammaproteobacteria bacterium]|nr:sodium-dependent transporter [Gammaproteobacteria bacterium]